MVWQDNLFGLNRQNYDILLKTSTDGGQTYGDVVNLSNNTADSHNHEISVSGSNVYVTWLDSQKYIQGDSRISFISSKDGGQTYGDVVNLSNNAGKSSFPKISSFGENVYLTWNIDREDQSITNTGNTTDGIFFIKSTDNGNSFDKEIRLNTEEKPGEVQIAANDNNVYIVWGSPDPSTVNQTNGVNSNGSNSDIGDGGDGIYFTKSIDNGSNFTNPVFIKDKFQNPLNVEIIEHFGELIIAIQAMPLNNTIEGNQDIFLMKSQDNGNTFSEAINISNNEGISECPSMAVSSDNNLFVVWQDKSTGNNEAVSTNMVLS